MISSRTISIIKRELKDKMMSKAFIISTLAFPLIMFGFIGLQAFVMSIEGDDNTTIEIIGETNVITRSLEREYEQQEFVKSGSYSLSYSTMGRGQFEGYVKDKKSDLIEERLNAVVYVPKSALESKVYEYYSITPKNNTVQRKLDGTINKVLIDIFFEGRNVSQADLDYARSSIETKTFKVDESDEIEESGVGNLILSYLFTFLLYISLLMMGSMMMQSVMEEKTNRIIELLLSSCSPTELMLGKTLGGGITGLAQMFIWLTPVLLVSYTAIFALPAKFMIDVSPFLLVYFLINFFVGLVTFLGLFAMMGSVYDNAQDAQSGMWPLMMLIIIPFFISFSLLNNPTNPVGEIASFLPFASIIIMPARLTIIEVPLWEVALSLALSIGTLILIFPLAGKVYRVGVLRTGKKPTFKDIVKWARA